MLPYWLMFFVPLWALLVRYRLPERQQAIAWAVVGTLFALMIGLRHEVGGDWFNYLGHFEMVERMSFMDALGRGDPGHYVLNWLVIQLGGNVYWVNLIYGCILMCGVVVFCRRQPWPWLGMLVAVPYMLVVVGMGYSRQAVALGFALLGLVALGEHRIRMFVLWIALGALFHKSAVLLLPIAVLASSRNRFLSGVMIVASTALMYYLLLADSAETMWTNYVEAEKQSQGGLIRVIMNMVPAVILLIYRKRLVPDPQERKLWMWIAIFAVACVPLVALASTAVDRVALYLIPLQIYVFARLPRLASTTKPRTALVLGIVAYYASVLFVWLSFANHSNYWVPYQFMPLT